MVAALSGSRERATRILRFFSKKNPLSFRKIGNPGIDISNPTHVLPMSRSGQTFRNNWRRFCCGWPPISCHVTAKTALMSTHSGAAFLQLLDGHGKQDPFSTRFFFIRSVLVLARTEPTLVVHHAWARACPPRKNRGFGASPTGKRSSSFCDENGWKSLKIILVVRRRFRRSATF